MEVCEGTTPTHESDMGIPNADAISIVCSIGGDSFITMERSEHISIGNAKVLLLGTFKTANADDAE